MTMPGKGILAMDESNATCGSRLEGVGVENNEENRRRYRELLITTPNLGEHIGGAILFEETLYQSCADGTSFVDALNAQGIYPGIKVDKVSACSRLPPHRNLEIDAPLGFEDFSLSEISWLHELPS